MDIAFIIGNGTSRKSFDLHELKKYGDIYGCNALYRVFTPDYLVAIDEKIITEIEHSDFPSSKCIFPVEEERWEPWEVYEGVKPDPSLPFGPCRSNAGMNAIIEAIRHGHKKIVCLGFDFLLLDEKQAVSNMFDGTNAYGPETRASLDDTRRRAYYLDYIVKINPEVEFYFTYNTGRAYALERPNFHVVDYDKMKNMLEKWNSVEDTKYMMNK